MSYKICVVPCCESTTIKTPDKLFIHVPEAPDMRKQWLELARRDFGNVLPKYTMYFCEDHFDLTKDMQNYIRFKIMGHVGQIRMKPNCLPTKFACQPDRRKRMAIPTNTPESMMSKRQCEILTQVTKRPIQDTEKATASRLSDTTIGVMTNVKTEIPDDGILLEDYNVSSMWNVHEHHIKVEDTTFQPYANGNTLEVAENLAKNPITCNDDYHIEPKITPELLLKTYNSSTQFHSCAACNESFASAELLKTHFTMCKGSKQEEPNDDLMIPYLKDLSTNLHRCTVCDDTFDTGDNLKTHLETHTDPNRHKCDVCQKAFPYASHLDVHKITHAGKPPYKCDGCEKMFPRKGKLLLHKRTVHMPYKCDICEQKFSRQKHLVSHKLEHSGERCYVCEVCNKKFARRDTLVLHKRIHSGERPYECDLCEKTFSQLSTLVVHKRMHSGERPFGCDVCQKKFAQNSALLMHKRTHTGDRPYDCDMCEKKFIRKYCLILHMRMHTGERPYECTVCGHRYTQKTLLIRHQQTQGHTEVKPDQLSETLK